MGRPAHVISFVVDCTQSVIAQVQRRATRILEDPIELRKPPDPQSGALFFVAFASKWPRQSLHRPTGRSWKYHASPQVDWHSRVYCLAGLSHSGSKRSSDFDLVRGPKSNSPSTGCGNRWGAESGWSRLVSSAHSNCPWPVL